MMKQDSYWKRFLHTGDVTDYLNYTACAREACRMAEEENPAVRYEEPDDSPVDDEEYEVEDDEWDAYREWDGSIGNADGRI